MDVLMECVGWKSGAGARRYAGMNDSIPSSGRGEAFPRNGAPAVNTDDALPLSKQFARPYAAVLGNNRSETQ